MRGMRLYKREITEPEELREVLELCDVVRIGAMDEEGMFIVPMNFGYEFKEKNGKCSLKLYLHGAKEGRKAEAFANNPNVAIEMDCGHEIIRGDYACSYSFAFRSIMGNGVIRRIDDIGEKRYGLELLMNHMEPGAKIQFLPEMMDRTLVYCIDVTEFTGKRRDKKKA